MASMICETTMGQSVPTAGSSSYKRAVLKRVLFIEVCASTPRLNAPKGGNWLLLVDDVVGSGCF